MPESDSAATQTARISVTENRTVPAISDPYLREQLEKRRDSLKVAISTIPLTDAPRASAPFHKLLADVDLAIRNMEEGTYGTCDVCQGSVESERLIVDPLARLCLDCLSSDEQRALEFDLELASRVQRGFLPETDLRHRDWRVHYLYRPAGIVSGDYCDLIPGAGDAGNLIFLLGDVTGKGVAASLLMTHLHAMFRALSGIGLELDRLMEMANRVFCESTIAGQYATLVCGRAGRSGEIEIASAGHFPVLFASKNGVTSLEATGLPLGMFSTSTYTVRRVRLEPETVCSFTPTAFRKRETIPARNMASPRYRARPPGGTAGNRRSGRGLPCRCRKHSSGRRPVDDQTVMVIQRSLAAEAAFND